MDRRTFLSTAALGLAGVATGLFGPMPSAAPERFPAVLVDTVFSNPARARTIGRYLLHHHVDPSPTRDDSDASLSVAPVPNWNAQAAPALIDTIRQNVRTDYANDQTICVDGWIMSQTEARWCLRAARA